MQRNEARYDIATALSQGARDYQEDAVIADFPVGSDVGIAVLSDGMGGHAAGDVASKIVMTEVFCELKFQSADVSAFRDGVQETLLTAAQGANECLSAHVAEHPDASGMGATLVAIAVIGRHLHWVSIGDSPLYLLRKGQLKQLNEDHSMAPQIDQMVEAGVLDEEAAKRHPDRNALLSVLSGEDVQKVDCPEEPYELENGDIIIVASDGVQFLEHDDLCKAIQAGREGGCAGIAREVLTRLSALSDPEQDNISMAAIRVELAASDEEMDAALKNAFHTFETAEPEERMFEPPQRARSMRSSSTAASDLAAENNGSSESGDTVAAEPAE